MHSWRMANPLQGAEAETGLVYLRLKMKDSVVKGEATKGVDRDEVEYCHGLHHSRPCRL